MHLRPALPATDRVRPSPEARRQQILDATCACARRAGFHGASMAEIAHTAGLSVGQIYRYFRNKEEIISAIVEQDLAEMREKFAELQNNPGSLAAKICAHVPVIVEHRFDPARVALVLEVMAEAARNPKVAAIVQDADAQERELSVAMVTAARKPGWTDAEIRARAAVIGMIFDGMIMQAVNNPGIDRQALIEVTRKVIHCVLDED